jgi:hypothetical protein
MTNSICFTQSPPVACMACVAMVFLFGSLNIVHAEHAVSPNDSAAATALTCFDTWLDSPAHMVPMAKCMYRAWRIASCDHAKILTASPSKIAVRDAVMRVLRFK